MNPATDAQKKHLLAQSHIAFGWDYANDVLKFARNQGFSVASIDELSVPQATKLLNRLDVINDPDRTPVFCHKRTP